MTTLADIFARIFRPITKSAITSATLPDQQMPGAINTQTVNTHNSKTLAKYNLTARKNTLAPWISQFSHKYFLPWGLLESLIKKESQYNDTKFLRSYRGAVGVAQLMPVNYMGKVVASIKAGEGLTNPRTGKRERITLPPSYLQGAFDPYDYTKNMEFAAWLLRYYYYPRYQNWAMAIAAYNAGQGTVGNAIKRGGSNWRASLPKETRDYVTVIGRETGLA